MSAKIHDVEQGSDEWLELRRGILTASEVKLIVTPTFKVATNDKTRAHIYELTAQRITGFVEEHYTSADMDRGHIDEVHARHLYTKHYEPVTEAGFITNDKWGFTMGYSPDGLVGDDGAIECKSRRGKFQVQTVLSNGTPPAEYMAQIQSGLLIAERKWCDFISYSGGLPMVVTRVHADDAIQAVILDAAELCEAKITESIAAYHAIVADNGWVGTERTEPLGDDEITIGGNAA